jgi:hypothetical protein
LSHNGHGCYLAEWLLDSPEATSLTTGEQRLFTGEVGELQARLGAEIYRTHECKCVPAASGAPPSHRGTHTLYSMKLAQNNYRACTCSFFQRRCIIELQIGLYRSIKCSIYRQEQLTLLVFTRIIKLRGGRPTSLGISLLLCSVCSRFSLYFSPARGCNGPIT